MLVMSDVSKREDARGVSTLTSQSVVEEKAHVILRLGTRRWCHAATGF